MNNILHEAHYGELIVHLAAFSDHRVCPYQTGTGVMAGPGCSVGVGVWRSDELLGGRALKRGQKESKSEFQI